MSLSKGELHLLVGPKASGKTEELIRLIKRYKIAGKETVIFKYSKDVGYNAIRGVIGSHNIEEALLVNKLCFKDDLIHMKDTKLNDVDVIGIDKAQFFDNNDLLSFVEQTVNDMGKIVIVESRNGSYERKPIGGITNLYPYANTIRLLTAICVYCGDDAPFTKRLDVNNKNPISPGGLDEYHPCCRSCFNNK